MLTRYLRAGFRPRSAPRSSLAAMLPRPSSRDTSARDSGLDPLLTRSSLRCSLDRHHAIPPRAIPASIRSSLVPRCDAPSTVITRYLPVVVGLERRLVLAAQHDVPLE